MKTYGKHLFCAYSYNFLHNTDTLSPYMAQPYIFINRNLNIRLSISQSELMFSLSQNCRICLESREHLITLPHCLSATDFPTKFDTTNGV